MGLARAVFVVALSSACTVLGAGAAYGQARKHATARAPSTQPPARSALTLSRADPGCIEQNALEELVERRLRRDVFAPLAEADILVEIEIRAPALGPELAPDQINTEDAGSLSPEPPADSAWTALFTLRTPRGEWIGTRELRLEAPACSQLNESLALVLALMIDVPRDQLPAPPEPPEPEETRPEKPPVATPRAREPSAAADPRAAIPSGTQQVPALGIEVAVAAVGGAGLLPELAPGIDVRLALYPRAFWPIEIGAAAFRETRAEVGNLGARFTLNTIVLATCPLTLDLRAPLTPTLMACLNNTVGIARADAFGFDTNRDERRTFYMLGGQLRVALKASELFRFRLGVGAHVPLTRDDFYFSSSAGDSRTLHQASPVVGTAELGIALRLR